MNEPQIIPPPNPKHKERKEYLILIGGVAALIAGIVLLFEFALGIILLVAGIAGVNRYLNKHPKR